MSADTKTPKKAGGSATATTPEERAAAMREAQRASRPLTRGKGRPEDPHAVAKYLRFSAQKGRLVVNQIRGKSVIEAATLLRFSERGAAREVFKVLRSAVANAEHNSGMSPDELFVKEAFCDEGPTFKRFKPRARGKADRINKRTCHVTVYVDHAPAELLEGRAGKTGGDRSARVAASQADKPGAKGSTDKAKATKAKSSSKAKPSKAAADETTADAAITEPTRMDPAGTEKSPAAVAPPGEPVAEKAPEDEHTGETPKSETVGHNEDTNADSSDAESPADDKTEDDQ